LQNGTKHRAKFLAKMYPFSILDFGLKRPKKPKSQKALTHPVGVRNGGPEELCDRVIV
jgi:hypothetical protein